MRTLTIGQAVVYHDEYNRPHPALITAIHGGKPVEGDPFTVTGEVYNIPEQGGDVFCLPCVNLVFVSGDERRGDTYGRQVERESSVVYKDDGVHGVYWRYVDDAPNERVNTIS